MSQASTSMTLSALYCNFHVAIPDKVRLQSAAMRETTQWNDDYFYRGGVSHTTAMPGLQDRRSPMYNSHRCSLRHYPRYIIYQMAQALQFRRHADNARWSSGDMAREELIDRASAGTVLSYGSMRVDAESVGTWFWGGLVNGGENENGQALDAFRNADGGTSCRCIAYQTIASFLRLRNMNKQSRTLQR